MAKNVQNVRNPTSVAATQIGLVGQFIWDQDLKAIRAHDGITPGGFAQLVATNNLGDLVNNAIARSNLGLGSAAIADTSDFDAAGAASAVSATLTPLISDAQDAADAAQSTADTAETHAQTGITNAATAQTTANTAITNAAAAQSGADASAKRASNLSDLASASTARTNLGLGTAATQASTAFDAAGAAAAAQVAAIAVSNQRANNLSDVANAATARGNLGIKTFSADTNLGAAAGTKVTIPHGLGVVPFSISFSYVWVGTAFGYTAGDVLELSQFSSSSSAFTVKKDATNIYIVFGNTLAVNVVKDDGTFTGTAVVTSNLALRVHALAVG